MASKVSRVTLIAISLYPYEFSSSDSGDLLKTVKEWAFMGQIPVAGCAVGAAASVCSDIHLVRVPTYSRSLLKGVGGFLADFVLE